MQRRRRTIREPAIRPPARCMGATMSAFCLLLQACTPHRGMRKRRHRGKRIQHRNKKRRWRGGSGGWRRKGLVKVLLAFGRMWQERTRWMVRYLIRGRRDGSSPLFLLFFFDGSFSLRGGGGRLVSLMHAVIACRVWPHRVCHRPLQGIALLHSVLASLLYPFGGTTRRQNATRMIRKTTTMHRIGASSSSSRDGGDGDAAARRARTIGPMRI